MGQLLSIPSKKRSHRIIYCLATALFTVTVGFSYTASATPEKPVLLAMADLTSYNIEELMDITVTSVSKKSQKIADAAAAIYVITQDDIRRSGVTSIAEALRMAPGVQVARLDSNKWAVTTRGFNGRFANKLLVLMDGRSLYTPYFQGIYWEVQDTPLEDIDRIEVIRGPGAALWGANAVNGVINIITRSAEKTVGTLVSTGAGSYEKSFITARQGFSLGENSAIRLYVKSTERDNFKDAGGNSTNDQWRSAQSGFRLDSKLTDRDTFTLQGDYFDGNINETYTLYHIPTFPDTEYSRLVQSGGKMSGGNVISRWQRTLSDKDSLSLQIYYDHLERSMLVSPQRINNIDLDFQHRLSLGSYQDLIWGAGYRFGQYKVLNTPTIYYDEQRVNNNLYSLFFHDEIKLLPEKLSLVLGSRFEHSDPSGFDVSPNGRLLWNVTPHDSIWMAASRTARSSTRTEKNINYNYRAIPASSGLNPFPVPLRLEIVGNPDFKSEELIAYEVGYRTEPLSHLSFDIATYYNTYKKLRVITPGAPYLEPTPNIVQPYLISNDMHGHAVGVEVVANWKPLDWWHLQTAYSYQKLTMYLDGKSSDMINKGNAESDVPQNQLSVRSGFELGKQVTLDLWLRGVDHLASIDGEKIPGYVELDLHIAWKPMKDLEVALVGQNLLDKHHPEFVPEYVNTVPTETPRSFYGKITWQY
ncbi:MAG: TonB-dependent receptor [Geobacteraceae bacterium]|nr:TonB-dependent receptor [Geobacteraceae bacterium]